MEQDIANILADPQYQGHPAREALSALMNRYQEQLTQLERLTSISDGYQTVLRERNASLTERYAKQVRQLQKIVRISDHYHGMLQELNDALRLASTQDALTGMPNRRFMMERLTAESAKAERTKSGFCVALADLDHFKQINDKFGHDCGDAALVAAAQTFTAGLRPYDVAARWGGEEFLLLLPDTNGAQGLEVANRMRGAIDQLQGGKLPPDLHLSVSIGVAEHHIGASWDNTIKQADQALYEAKHKGRNRVVLVP